ncbi:MAG: hypothetical protein QG580_253 [Patescibacteria group bacterium]|jgi:hypothetical protein|nr:hypothetical protein [Patescibacteria group bacterium]
MKEVKTYLVRSNQREALNELIFGQHGIFKLAVDLNGSTKEYEFRRWKMPINPSQLDKSTLTMLVSQLDIDLLPKFNVFEWNITLGCVNGKNSGDCFSCALLTSGDKQAFVLSLPEGGRFYEDVVRPLRAMSPSASMVGQS